MNYDRCYQIFEGLKKKGFAVPNTVSGIGSFTFQYQTRDTFGQAIKCTYGVVDGKGYNIYKDPKTDDGVKSLQKDCFVLMRIIRLVKAYLLRKKKKVCWKPYTRMEKLLRNIV